VCKKANLRHFRNLEYLINYTTLEMLLIGQVSECLCPGIGNRLIRTTSQRKKDLDCSKKTKIWVLYLLKLTLLSSRGRLGVSTGLILRYCSFFFILYQKCNIYKKLRKLCHLCLNIWRQKKHASETKLRGKQVTPQFFLADFLLLD
jgi:hypothetical protein